MNDQPSNQSQNNPGNPAPTPTLNPMPAGQPMVLSTSPTSPGNNNQPAKKKKNVAVIILAVIGGIVVGIIALAVIIIMITSAQSEKLVCESERGNITLMYDDSTIIGYTAVGVSYDLDGQKEIAERLGIDRYLTNFATEFEARTATGTCTRSDDDD